MMISAAGHASPLNLTSQCFAALFPGWRIHH
jgi:hypothetical protein